MKRIITWMIYFSDTYTFIYINYSQIMLGLKNSSRLFVRSFVRLFVLILYILWRFTLFSMLLLSFLPYKSSVCNVRFSFLARSWAHTHTHTRTLFSLIRLLKFVSFAYVTLLLLPLSPRNAAYLLVRSILTEITIPTAENCSHALALRRRCRCRRFSV